MSSSDEKLAAKVAAVNMANGQASDLSHVLRGIFLPLIGEQICKKEGGLLAKVAKLLPPLPNSREVVIYRHESEYSLAWVVRVCVLRGEVMQSHEVTVYVGTLDGGRLTVMYEPFKGRSDWTPQEVVAKREAYWAAKKAAESFKEAFYPFTEYET